MFSELVTNPPTLPRSLVIWKTVDSEEENRVIKIEDPYAIEIRIAVADPRQC